MKAEKERRNQRGTHVWKVILQQRERCMEGKLCRRTRCLLLSKCIQCCVPKEV